MSPVLIRRLAGVGIFLLLFFSPSLTLQAAEKKESLTVEELTQSKANQLFVTRQFAEALEEFKKLEKEHPKDIVIKRYLGACLDHLRRDEEAIEAFKKVLKLNPEDLPSRQFLSKIHLRRGDIDQAEDELKFLVEHDKTMTFAPQAKVQLATIQRLREAKAKAVQAPGRMISPNEFLKTKAAQAFMNAKYEEALAELKELEKRYPGDLLIKRYQGITLDKLMRFDEAILALQEGLSAAPENIPLHYFLAQIFLHKQDYAGAKREYEYVIVHDETRAYQTRAKAELDALERLLEQMKRAKPKKWSVNASSGFDWVSNPNSVTRERGLRTGNKDTSFKYSSSAGGSYELFKKGAWSGRSNYSYSQSIYSDDISALNTFSNSGGINFTYIRPLWGKPLITQFGHTTAHTIIRKRFYSASFSESLTEMYSPYDWYRITLSEKWSYNAYDSDGSAPDKTSRDGYGNVFGVTNTIYLNKAKTLTHTLALEYTRDMTQGINYRKDAFSTRAALRFPLRYKWEGDLSFKMKASQYPKYGFPDTHIGRRDQEYTLGTTLSRTFKRYWTLSGAYTYVNNHSKDANFTYTNYTVGLSLAYNY